MRLLLDTCVCVCVCVCVATGGQKRFHSGVSKSLDLCGLSSDERSNHTRTRCVRIWILVHAVFAVSNGFFSLNSRKSNCSYCLMRRCENMKMGGAHSRPFKAARSEESMITDLPQNFTSPNQKARNKLCNYGANFLCTFPILLRSSLAAREMVLLEHRKYEQERVAFWSQSCQLLPVVLRAQKCWCRNFTTFLSASVILLGSVTAHRRRRRTQRRSLVVP